MIGLGHSGGGAAMLRFALIHPEQFETVIIGGNGDIIPTPFWENGEELGYPFGIKDYFEIDTKPVYDTIRDENYEEGRSGPLFAPKVLADLYKAMYGTSFFERFKKA